MNVLKVFDYEEEGSGDSVGAECDFLEVVLKKFLNDNLKNYNNFVSKSLFVSFDNTQGIHPNYMRLYDKQNSHCLVNDISIKKSSEDS